MTLALNIFYFLNKYKSQNNYGFLKTSLRLLFWTFTYLHDLPDNSEYNKLVYEDENPLLPAVIKNNIF